MEPFPCSKNLPVNSLTHGCSRSTYARALKDTGRASAAVEIYKAAVRRWPAEASLYHDLAVAAHAAGDAAEALRAEQAALTLGRQQPGGA